MIVLFCIAFGEILFVARQDCVKLDNDVFIKEIRDDTEFFESLKKVHKDLQKLQGQLFLLHANLLYFQSFILICVCMWISREVTGPMADSEVVVRIGMSRMRRVYNAISDHC